MGGSLAKWLIGGVIGLFAWSAIGGIFGGGTIGMLIAGVASVAAGFFGGNFFGSMFGGGSPSPSYGIQNISGDGGPGLLQQPEIPSPGMIPIPPPHRGGHYR